MAISDVTASVTCDECGEVETRELPFRYPDYSGKNGFHSLPALVEDLEGESWEISPETDGSELGAHVTCPGCSEDDADDD